VHPLPQAFGDCRTRSGRLLAGRAPTALRTAGVSVRDRRPGTADPRRGARLGLRLRLRLRLPAPGSRLPAPGSPTSACG